MIYDDLQNKKYFRPFLGFICSHGYSASQLRVDYTKGRDRIIAHAMQSVGLDVELWPILIQEEYDQDGFVVRLRIGRDIGQDVPTGDELSQMGAAMVSLFVGLFVFF